MANKTLEAWIELCLYSFKAMSRVNIWMSGIKYYVFMIYIFSVLSALKQKQPVHTTLAAVLNIVVCTGCIINNTMLSTAAMLFCIY